MFGNSVAWPPPPPHQLYYSNIKLTQQNMSGSVTTRFFCFFSKGGVQCRQEVTLSGTGSVCGFVAGPRSHYVRTSVCVHVLVSARRDQVIVCVLMKRNGVMKRECVGVCR